MLPVVGTDAVGNNVVVWNEGTRVKAAHYAVASGAWSVPEFLSPAGDRATQVGFAMNAAGQAVAKWTNLGPVGSSNRFVQAATFSTQTLAWSPPATVAPQGYQFTTRMGIDGAGNDWRAADRLRALRWDATQCAQSGVSAGTYYVQVVAISAVGLGDVSNTVTITVP